MSDLFNAFAGGLLNLGGNMLTQEIQQGYNRENMQKQFENQKALNYQAAMNSATLQHQLQDYNKSNMKLQNQYSKNLAGYSDYIQRQFTKDQPGLTIEGLKNANINPLMAQGYSAGQEGLQSNAPSGGASGASAPAGGASGASAPTGANALWNLANAKSERELELLDSQSDKFDSEAIKNKSASKLMDDERKLIQKQVGLTTAQTKQVEEATNLTATQIRKTLNESLVVEGGLGRKVFGSNPTVGSVLETMAVGLSVGAAGAVRSVGIMLAQKVGTKAFSSAMQNKEFTTEFIKLCRENGGATREVQRAFNKVVSAYDKIMRKYYKS